MSIKFPNMKHFLSLFLAAVMMAGLLAVNAHAANANKITDYGDAYGHWAYEALTWAVDNGVMVGTSEDKLNPDGYLTRAQMAAMIDRLFGTYKSADISRYTDVSRGSWYYDYIAQAVHMGTFAGYSNSRMGPNDNITREQAIVVLARTVCLPSAGNSALARFPDWNQVGAWAADSVAAMVERGYVSGYNDGRLNPKGQITRAEMAQIMCNIFQSVYETGDVTGSYQSTVLVRGGANVHDAVFDGDLIIANGLGENSLDLDNITVNGRLVVWGGSAVNVSGKSTVAGVVLPRNDGPVQVVFDAAATELSEKGCSIVKPSTMDRGNKVLFTDKANAPTIAFDLPAYLYVGDSATVKTTLTDADAVTWELTRDGKSCDMPEGFTKDGGMLFFLEAGRYTLKGTVENSGGTGSCEKTVEVLPIGDIAFSLPEYGYTDRAEDVKLLTKNDLTGAVAWTLTWDGNSVPIPEDFTKDGGTLALTETGVYTLTANAADISKKVRAQQHQAMKDGEFVGARPPYGYRKDPDNCHRLLVNEDTAPVVRQIFQWTLDGVALNVIVKRLNESGVMTPGYYHASCGLFSYDNKLAGSGKWQTWTVGKILADEVYTGDMVQGKHTNIGHKQVLTKPEDWIIVRDTHELIISRELFAKAQAVREQMASQYTRTMKTPYSENILRGRVFCAYCGKNLHRQRSHGRYFYRCISNDRMGKGSCTGGVHRLPEPDLFDMILTIIRQKAEVVMGEALRLKQCDGKIAAQKAEADREIAELVQQTKKNKDLLAGLYENFVKGILTRTEYLEMQERYSRKVSGAVERVQQLQVRQSELERQMERHTSMADKLAAVGKDTALSALLVNQLIERVTVNGPDDVSINFSFEGGFERVMEVLGNE